MLRLGGKALLEFKRSGRCLDAALHKTNRKPMRYDTQRHSFVTSQRVGKPQTPGNEEDFGKPIKFSTSKASHRTWKVERSLGSHYERPWWTVVPVSLIAVCFLLWCIFRQESELDKQLDRDLYEHVPGLLSSEDEDEETNKPNS